MQTLNFPGDITLSTPLAIPDGCIDFVISNIGTIDVEFSTDSNLYTSDKIVKPGVGILVPTVKETDLEDEENITFNAGDEFQVDFHFGKSFQHSL